MHTLLKKKIIYHSSDGDRGFGGAGRVPINVEISRVQYLHVLPHAPATVRLPLAAEHQASEPGLQSSVPPRWLTDAGPWRGRAAASRPGRQSRGGRCADSSRTLRPTTGRDIPPPLDWPGHRWGACPASDTSGSWGGLVGYGRAWSPLYLLASAGKAVCCQRPRKVIYFIVLWEIISHKDNNCEYACMMSKKLILAFRFCTPWQW